MPQLLPDLNPLVLGATLHLDRQGAPTAFAITAKAKGVMTVVKEKAGELATARSDLCSRSDATAWELALRGPEIDPGYLIAWVDYQA